MISVGGQMRDGTENTVSAEGKRTGNVSAVAGNASFESDITMKAPINWASMVEATARNADHHVLVLGAGVIGVTTAWYLRQAGYQVTVIEQASAPALQTSYANGGQISVSHATPWANPATPRQVLRWLGKADAPLLWHLRADAKLWRWTWRFLQECRAKRADANLVQIVRLGLYSRQALQSLRQALGLHYDQQTRGIMHIYTDANEFESAKIASNRMQALGCERSVIEVATAVSLEPALYPIAHRLTGATYTPADESGDAHRFTQVLAAHCQQAGVRFCFDTQVLSLIPRQPSKSLPNSPLEISAVLLQNDTQGQYHLPVDKLVVALGCDSASLLAPLGVRLPVYPVKGYSATYQVNPKSPHLAPFVSLIDDEYKLVMSRFGDRLRVAGTAELAGYDTRLTPARCEALTRRITKLFPKGIVTDSVQYWAGLRPMTPSNVPLIGRARQGSYSANISPNTVQTAFTNLWLNTGHGSLGWTHACGSAKALSLLMQGEPAPIDFQFL